MPTNEIPALPDYQCDTATCGRCDGDEECPCECHDDDGNGTCDVCGSALDYMGLCAVCPAEEHDPSLDVIDCDDGTCPADRG